MAKYDDYGGDNARSCHPRGTPQKGPAIPQHHQLAEGKKVGVSRTGPKPRP